MLAEYKDFFPALFAFCICTSVLKSGTGFFKNELDKRKKKKKSEIELIKWTYVLFKLILIVLELSHSILVMSGLLESSLEFHRARGDT